METMDVKWQIYPTASLGPYSPSDESDSTYKTVDLDWRSEFVGCVAGQFKITERLPLTPQITTLWTLLLIPYHHIALPLSLLSAGLLIWKPRKKATAATTNGVV